MTRRFLPDARSGGRPDLAALEKLDGVRRRTARARRQEAARGGQARPGGGDQQDLPHPRPAHRGGAVLGRDCRRRASSPSRDSTSSSDSCPGSSPAHSAELRGVSTDRAHQVPAGAVVAAAAMRAARRTVRADLSVGAARGCHPAQAGLVGRSVMAEPDWNPDTGGRSLAEILREAGIESANRAARRRTWDDPEETGIRQRRAEAAAAGRPELGRRKSDRSLDEGPPVTERRAAPERRAALGTTSGRRPARDAPGRAGPVDGGDPGHATRPQARRPGRRDDAQRPRAHPPGRRASAAAVDRPRGPSGGARSSRIRRPAPSPSSVPSSSRTPTTSTRRRGRARSPGCASPAS